MVWVVTFLNKIVENELAVLPADMQAYYLRIAERIEHIGLEKVREPNVKHIENKIWEIRLIGREGIARALYITASGKKVVVIRIFIKKTQKTPREEINIAYQRMKEYGL